MYVYIRNYVCRTLYCCTKEGRKGDKAHMIIHTCTYTCTYIYTCTCMCISQHSVSMAETCTVHVL